MEQPPTPPNQGSSEPDLPKPPIWEEQAAARPAPQLPPQAAAAAAGAAASAADTGPMPIVPDTATPGPTFGQREFLSVPPTQATTPPVGVPTILPTTADRPQWPATPPTAGYQPGPAPAPVKRSRARAGLIVLSLLCVAGLAAGAFIFGRSYATESTTVPVAAPAVEATATPPEPTTPPATAAPVPTIPATPETADAPAPAPLPLNEAVEPVAAVARAVAPAVVLIQNELGQGSGIIYDESGLILTNAHVVGQFTEVTVQLASGVLVPGEVLGADNLTDVAVVKIAAGQDFGVAALAPESSVEVGQLAVAIGSPFGLDQTVTSGIVSAVGRVLENQTETGALSIVAMIQTDAPINPGNSGGALADRQGRVIGMNTSIRTDGTGGNIGVGFAIPADTAKLIADRIISGEPLEQGFLGIGRGDTPLFGTPGALVGSVTPGSGAANAGLQPGDLITGFNGRPIDGMSALAAEVRLQPPNATIDVEFERDGESFTVQVTLGVLTEP